MLNQPANSEYSFTIPDKINLGEDLHIELAAKEKLTVLVNLSQAYEAEFSKITGKEPGTDGVFMLDTFPKFPYAGYVLYKESIPIGFCVLNVESNPRDVAEFYIIPTERRQGMGTKLAYSIFDAFGGDWQVRQIAGADQAVIFWRTAISQYTNNNYEESIIDDPKWGVVTKQDFSS